MAKSNSRKDFEQLYGRELTPEELYECEYNVYGFFHLLYKIQKRILETETKEKAAGQQGRE